jgi:hypothetical protein
VETDAIVECGSRYTASSYGYLAPFRLNGIGLIIVDNGTYDRPIKFEMQ